MDRVQVACWSPLSVGIFEGGHGDRNATTIVVEHRAVGSRPFAFVITGAQTGVPIDLQRVAATWRGVHYLRGDRPLAVMIGGWNIPLRWRHVATRLTSARWMTARRLAPPRTPRWTRLPIGEHAIVKARLLDGVPLARALADRGIPYHRWHESEQAYTQQVTQEAKRGYVDLVTRMRHAIHRARRAALMARDGTD